VPLGTVPSWCTLCPYFLSLAHFWLGPPSHLAQAPQVSVTEKVTLLPMGAEGLREATTVPQPSWPRTVGQGSSLLPARVCRSELQRVAPSSWSTTSPSCSSGEVGRGKVEGARTGPEGEGPEYTMHCILAILHTGGKGR